MNPSNYKVVSRQASSIFLATSHLEKAINEILAASPNTTLVGGVNITTNGGMFFCSQAINVSPIAK